VTRRPAQGSSDDAAWIREAVARFEGPLTSYAFRLVGDIERARDIAQDTFLKLWTADRAEVDGHLAQWLYRVCRNRALDVCRKELRMKTVEHEKLERLHDGGTPADAAEDRRRLSQMLNLLPDRQQEVLRLKFQAGLSYQEIGNVMNITANHVGVLIHTALKSIRERMQALEARVTCTTPAPRARVQP
jgi:RNA polymerase sigma factor (sigma-70 family)